MVTNDYSKYHRLIATDIDGRFTALNYTVQQIKILIESDLPNVTNELKTSLSNHLNDHSLLEQGNYKLVLQTDGNLVLYDSSSGSDVVIWSALYGIT